MNKLIIILVIITGLILSGLHGYSIYLDTVKKNRELPQERKVEIVKKIVYDTIDVSIISVNKEIVKEYKDTKYKINTFELIIILIISFYFSYKMCEKMYYHWQDDHMDYGKHFIIHLILCFILFFISIWDIYILSELITVIND